MNNELQTAKNDDLVLYIYYNRQFPMDKELLKDTIIPKKLLSIVDRIPTDLGEDYYYNKLKVEIENSDVLSDKELNWFLILTDNAKNNTDTSLFYDEVLYNLGHRTVQEEQNINKKGFEFMNMKTSAQKYAGQIDPMMWEGWIPNSAVGLLTAQGGVGKGWFALEIANILISDKQYWMDGQEREQKGSQKVLYLDFEDSVDELNRRVESLGIDTTKLFVLSEEDKENFTVENKEFLNELEQFIIAEQIKLVIVDSLNEATPGINENDSKDVQRVLAPLRHICQATGCTIMIIHHNDKTDKGYRGSTAWAAQVRFIITLTAKDDKIEVRQAKLNRRKSKNKISFVLDDDENGNPKIIISHEINEDIKKAPKTTKIQRMRTWLLTEFMTKTYLKLDYIKECCETAEWDYKYLTDHSGDIFKDQKNKIWYLKERPIDFPADCLIYENQLPIDMEEGN